MISDACVTGVPPLSSAGPGLGLRLRLSIILCRFVVTTTYKRLATLDITACFSFDVKKLHILI